MASLGLVSPGAQLTVSPLFFPEKKTDNLFNHHRLSVLQCYPYFPSQNLTTFLVITVTFFYFTGLSPPPPWTVSPRTFLPVRLRLSTVLCTFSHIFFLIRVSPLEGVTRGGPPSDIPLVASSQTDNTHTHTFLFYRTTLSVDYVILVQCDETAWPIKKLYHHKQTNVYWSLAVKSWIKQPYSYIEFAFIHILYYSLSIAVFCYRTLWSRETPSGHVSWQRLLQVAVGNSRILTTLYIKNSRPIHNVHIYYRTVVERRMKISVQTASEVRC